MNCPKCKQRLLRTKSFDDERVVTCNNPKCDYEELGKRETIFLRSESSGTSMYLEQIDNGTYFRKGSEHNQ